MCENENSFVKQPTSRMDLVECVWMYLQKSLENLVFPYIL